MGEFEKRIKEVGTEVDYVETANGGGSWHPDEGQLLLTSTYILKLLNEAKNKFPKGIGLLSYYNRMKWFKKWFGDE